MFCFPKSRINENGAGKRGVFNCILIFPDLPLRAWKHFSNSGLLTLGNEMTCMQEKELQQPELLWQWIVCTYFEIVQQYV